MPPFVLCITALLTFLPAMGIWWDRWWHIAVGRDQFWIPPHLLILIPVAVSALLIAFWLRRGNPDDRARRSGWWFIWLSLAFFAAIAFDEAWHRLYGEERIDSLLILWSPPHLAIAALLAIRALVLTPLFYGAGPAAWLRIPLFAAAIAHADFMLKPFSPFDIYRVLGPWGIIPTSALLVGVLMAARMQGGMSAFLTASAYLTAQQLGAASQAAAWVPLPAVSEYPQWLKVFTVIGSAMAIDLGVHALAARPFVLAALAGGLFGAIGGAATFLPPNVPLSAAAMGILITGGAAGGIIGFAVSRIRPHLPSGGRLGFLLAMAAIAVLAAGSLALPLDWRKPWQVTPEAAMPERLSEFATAAIGDDVYVLGGYDERGLPSARAYRFSAASRQWQALAALPQALHHPAAASAGGALYVAGGFSNPLTSPQQPEQAFFRFNPNSGTWERLPEFKTARGAAALAARGNSLYLIGGNDASSKSIAAVERFDRTTGRWHDAAPLPTPVNHLAAVVLNDAVVVLGGRSYRNPSAHPRDFANTSAVLRYDPISERWSSLPDLHGARSGFAAAAIDASRIYVAGGEAPGIVLANAGTYDISSGAWEDAPAPRYARHGFGLAAAGNRLWAFGGAVNPRFSVSDVVEVISLGRLATPTH